ncbi:MAG: hypothetical protein LC112_13915 [Flavobacteriales bacterium]|nr:hypothetical protein [Flavobacteriales bacterium]
MTLQQQLLELRSRRIDNYNKAYAEAKAKLDALANEHRDLMHWHEDFQYMLPRLVEACSKAKLEIVNISGTNKKLMLDCNPKGFSKMEDRNYSKAHERRRGERAEKIQNTIKENYQCSSVHCNEFSLEGDGFILIEIYS